MGGQGDLQLLNRFIFFILFLYPAREVGVNVLRKHVQAWTLSAMVPPNQPRFCVPWQLHKTHTLSQGIGVCPHEVEEARWECRRGAWSYLAIICARCA